MVKKLFKSVHIYRSYRQNKPGGPFFWTTRYILIGKQRYQLPEFIPYSKILWNVIRLMTTIHITQTNKLKKNQYSFGAYCH